MKKGPQKTVSVAMPLELYDVLKRLAEEDVRSIPSYIRLVLWDHLEKKHSVPPQRQGSFGKGAVSRRLTEDCISAKPKCMK